MREEREQKDYMTLELIAQVITEPKIIDKILKCLFIIKIIDERGNSNNELKNSRKKLLKYYKEMKKYRIINYRDSLLESHQAEYFGRDYDKNDPYNFKEDIEKINMEVSEIIVDALAIAYTKLTISGSGRNLEDLLSGGMEHDQTDI